MGFLDLLEVPIVSELKSPCSALCTEAPESITNIRSSGLRAPHPLDGPVSRRTPGRPPFHPKQTLRGATFNRPIRFPEHLFSVHDHGRQRSDRKAHHLSCPYVGLTVRWAVFVQRRPAGDPVDSDPGAVFEDDCHPRSDAGRLQEPWVYHHTREPTVLFRVSTAALFPEFWPFSPALPVPQGALLG